MKKAIVFSLLVAILAVPAMSSAQDYKQALRYEIKGGLVTTFITGNNYQDTGTGTGYAVGAGLTLPLFTQSLGVMFEAYYTQKEMQLTLSGTPTRLPPSSNGNYTINMTYVEVPVLVQLALVNADNARAYLMGGGQIGVNATASVDYADAQGANQSEDLEGVDSLDWAPVIGMGFRMERFLVEFRLAWSVNNVGDDNADVDHKISSTYIFIGFSF